MTGNGRELDAEERAILTLLEQAAKRPEDRTASRIATTLRCDPDDVSAALVKLEREGLTLSVCGPTREVTWMSTSLDAS